MVITRYEYMRLTLDFGDLSDLNSLSSEGWKVVAVVPDPHDEFQYYVLLERPSTRLEI